MDDNWVNSVEPRVFDSHVATSNSLREQWHDWYAGVLPMNMSVCTKTTLTLADYIAWLDLKVIFYHSYPINRKPAPEVNVTHLDKKFKLNFL